MAWTEENIKKYPVLSGIGQILSVNELGVIAPTQERKSHKE